MLKTLVDVLRQRAEQSPDDLAYLFMHGSRADDVVARTYRQLAQQTSSIARYLIEAGATGERVILLFDPGLDYIAAFFGVLQAGAVAVPSFTPSGSRALARIASILDDAEPALVLTSSHIRAFEARIRAQCAKPRDCPWVAIDDITSEAASGLIAPVAGQALALLQYTSGSTGQPKGVMVSHDNLMSDCAAMARWMGPLQRWMGCSWLPPQHDIGLMGGILQPLYAGFPVLLFSPAHFVQSPARWLQAISQHRVTVTVAPNFALDLCVDSIDDDELAGLDLSALEHIFCGAEPIRQATFDRFHKRFAPYGFRYQAFNPCYGMAEATLFVSGKRHGTLARCFSLDKPALDDQRVVEAEPGDAHARPSVSCGEVALDHRVRIVDPDTQIACAPGGIGEIWVSGPSVAQGYWQRDAATEATFHASLAAEPGTFLRTGDLGFLRDGELYVTGRLKDVIIIAGRNHYPQDIELTAQQAHADVRGGASSVAAFSIEQERSDALVIFAEVRRATKSAPVDLNAVRAAITRDVTALHGLRPHRVLLGAFGAVPRTTSGKVQRWLCKQHFLAGSLPVIEHSEGQGHDAVHTL